MKKQELAVLRSKVSNWWAWKIKSTERAEIRKKYNVIEGGIIPDKQLIEIYRLEHPAEFPRKHSGGLRPNAGRKPVEDKKVQLTVSFRQSVIDAAGGRAQLKKDIETLVTKLANL